MTGERLPSTRWLVAIPLAVCAIALALWAATPYPGVTVDSAEYLAVAEGFAEGRGFTMPYVGFDEPYRVLQEGERVAMTQFPPLYPAALAAVGALGPDMLDAARALGAVLYGALVFAVQIVALRWTGRVAAGLVAGGLTLHPDLVAAHATAWSEPLMLLAVVGAIDRVARYVDQGGRGHLVAAFALGSIASLARFAGVAAIAGVAVVAILWRRPRSLTATLTTVALAVVAMLPISLWFARNVSLLGAASEKKIAWHPPGARHIGQSLQTVGGWIAPYRPIATTVGALAVAAVVLWLVRARTRRDRKPASTNGLVCLTFGILYAGFVLATRTLLDQNIALDARILSPLLVIAILGLAGRTRSRVPGDRPRAAAIGLAVIAVVAAARGGAFAARYDTTSIAAYTGDAWRASPTLRAAGALPPDTVVVTNAPDPVWLWHDRLPVLVPPASDRYSGTPNPDYLRHIEDVAERIGCRSATFVFFDRPTRKPARALDPVLVERLALDSARRLPDGALYDIGSAEDC